MKKQVVAMLAKPNTAKQRGRWRRCCGLVWLVGCGLLFRFHRNINKPQLTQQRH